MHGMRVRIAVAVLFIASLLGAVLLRAGGDDERAAPPAPTTTVPPATLVPTTSSSTSTTLVPITIPPDPPGTEARAVRTPSGVIAPVLARTGAAYRVQSPCGRPVEVAGATALTRPVVVLDAGHGGVEPGAVGPGGLREKDLNLAVTEQARAALEARGVTVVMTRTADYRITIGTRARIALALQPRAFVSIHHNAEPDEPWPRPGVETYYQVASADSKRLAGLIYEEVLAALTPYGVPWVADRDAGAKYRRNTAGDDYYGIIRQTQGVPGVLAELGFISNGPEEALYSRADVQAVEGQAVARGIIRFLTTADPGSGYTEPYPRESPAGSGGGASNCVDPPL